MSIITVSTQAEADAISGPKHLWYNLGEIVVYTGDDIPTQPTASEITVEELRGRFTVPEMTDILSFARTDDNAGLLLFKLQTRTTPIPKNDPSLLWGLNYLVDSGKLAANRIVEILG
jgi:hypothetical protein